MASHSTPTPSTKREQHKSNLSLMLNLNRGRGVVGLRGLAARACGTRRPLIGMRLCGAPVLAMCALPRRPLIGMRLCTGVFALIGMFCGMSAPGWHTQGVAARGKTRTEHERDRPISSISLLSYTLNALYTISHRYLSATSSLR